MPDIIKFITDRIDDDEIAAKAWLPFGNPNAEQREHRARYNTGRVLLREVKAHRAILKLHGRMSIKPGHPMFNDAHITTIPMVLCRSCEPETMWRREKSFPCRTLRTLAYIWSDHPDYNQHWAPDPSY